MSSISATIGGAARLVASGSEEEKYYYDQHLENNTFEEGEQLFRQPTSSGQEPTDRFVQGEEVGVIVVDIKTVRISDWKGGVRDWALVETPAVNGSV